MTNTEHNPEKPETTESDPYNIIKGLRFNSKLYQPDVVRTALEYVARDDDIFIATIPKSGTTWMQTIVYALLNKGQAFDKDVAHYIAHNPYLEMHGRQAVEEMPRPGAIKSHLPFDRLPYNPKAKYICVVRNPKDVFVSFHRFITTIEGEAVRNISFDTLFEHFLAGKTCHVDYFDHLLSYWSHRNDANVLLVLYEDMKKDIRSVISRVATFLNIEIDGKLCERIATHTSFDYLKTARYNERIVPAHTFAVLKFLRKGIVGDWRTVFSVEQDHLLDKHFQEKTACIPELNELWDEHNIFTTL